MSAAPTPFRLVSAVADVRSATKAELIARSHELERGALAAGASRVVACLQDQRYVTQRVRSTYAELAARGTEVTLVARGLQAWLAPGVAGLRLADDDPLTDEWCVLVGDPDVPVAFTATDLRAPGAADLERAFTWAQTSDRDVVEACLALFASGPALTSSSQGRP